MDKRTIELLILKTIRLNNGELGPTDIFKSFTISDLTIDNIRDAVARLADRGAIVINSKLKIELPNK